MKHNANQNDISTDLAEGYRILEEGDAVNKLKFTGLMILLTTVFVTGLSLMISVQDDIANWSVNTFIDTRK